MLMVVAGCGVMCIDFGILFSWYIKKENLIHPLVPSMSVGFFNGGRLSVFLSFQDKS